MRVGIGCTTYRRPECLAKWKEQIAKHTSMENVLIYIAVDTDVDRRGVAARKNECLRALKDCDYIFLFDDDCYPIKDGWIENWVNSEHRHYLYLNKTHNFIGKYTNYSAYSDCGGVFMYMTKKCLEATGAFDENFKTWGFEHADWSMRAYGFNGYTIKEFYSLNNSGEYLFSEDYSNPQHKSSISDEEKKKYFDLNFPKFKEPIKDIYIPL